jgi:hypothetical protein
MDGRPPYTAFFSNPGIFVQPIDANSNPGRFRVTVVNTAQCLTAEPVIFRDNGGGSATLSITTTKGPAATPPPAMVVSPTAITLACGTSGSVTVVGGSGTYAATSTHQRVIATVVGNSVSIQRLSGDPPLSTWPTTATVTVTDGATAKDVTVTITGTNASGACP